MNYEIVNLKEKTVAGLSAEANLNSPESSGVIGKLWEHFYGGTYASIQGKVNERCIGLYTDYKQDGGYRVMVCCETDTAEQDADTMVIPAGKYAKFIIRGHIVTAVQEFWQKLWEMKLDRSFVCDFEEYQGGDMENMEIHMYISLK